MNETYIKMCDCPEIQGQKPQWLDGEFVALRGVDTKAEQAGEWLMHTDDRFVWCPMQHQLQEMVSGQFFTYEGSDEAKMPNPAGMIHCFSEFYNERYEYASYETAWLAFAMEELHNKTWDGETWIGGNDGK